MTRLTQTFFRRSSRLLLFLLAVIAWQTSWAQSTYDAMAPFGFATCTSRTATGYSLTGGGAKNLTEAAALESSKVTTLTSTGSAMDTEILNTIKNYDVIIFDGSNGDFILDKFVTLDNLSGKTLLGKNGAKITTKWYATAADIAALEAENVSSKSTSSGSNTKCLPGETSASISEEAEYYTRYIMIQRYDPDAITNNTKSTESWRNSGIFYIKECQNLIIRNLTFQGPGSMDLGGADIISIKNSSKNIWIDHCDFVDGQDGNMDITEQSDLITVSWCKFHYSTRSYMHQNTNLCGSSDDVTADDDKLAITWAYNHWGEKCKQRMPMARMGRFHMLNNYYTSTGCSLCMNPRKNSEFLIEGNYFDASVTNVYRADDATTVICRSNNSATGASTNYALPTSDDATATSTLIPYTYGTSMTAANVPTEVGTYVGATIFGDIKSTACQLTSVQFSNSAYGSITEPSGTNNGKIVVPYMAGSTAPTVTESSIKVSDKATAAVNGNTLVVTAEDGTTKATYDITTQAVTPLSVSSDIAETAFTAVPSWAYNPGGYSSDYGVKFSKAVDDASNMRIASGKTRQYYFIAAAKKLTLTSGTSSRAINVYVNGTKLDSPTASGASGSTIEIPLNETEQNMVCIVSNQTSGDGGFTKYAITSTGSSSITITATWDFTTSTSAASLSTAINKNSSGTIASDVDGIVLSVTTDANGKFSPRPSNGDVQINANTTIKIPVKSNKDVITITNYSTDANQYNITYSIGTLTGINAQSKEYTASDADVTAGYATMTVTGNGYAKKIVVVQHESSAATYTITYHNNGHGTAPDNVTSATALPNPLPTMSEEGYTFDGWFTDDGLTTAAVAGATLTANADLYAKWTQNSTATYPLTATWDFETTGNYTAGQYNKQNDSTPFTVASSSVTSASAQNLTVNVTTGKFYTNANNVQVNNGTKIQVPITSNSDVVTVKAYSGFQSYFTIGGVTMSAQTVEHTATNAEATQKYVEIIATGNGYLLKISVLQKNEQIVKGTKTVTYYDYDGTTSLGTQTVTEGEAVGTFEKTCTPPTGYTFEGWYTAEGSAFTTTSTVTEDVSVYPYIYKVENGYYQIPANCGKVLLYTLNKAVADEKIYVPDGTYDFGTASATIKVNNVSIIGQSMSGTLIKNTPAAESLKVCLLHNTGTETYIQDLTLQSYAPWNATNKAERSSGLFDEGTKTICKNVYLKGTQDTYLSNKKDMYAYFDGGKIEGTVDFICGSGKVFFEGVNIYCANSSTYGGGTGKTTGDIVIAPQALANDAANTPVYGYVFNNCTLDGESTQNNNFTLGRGWGQDNTRTEYIYSLFAHTTKAINYKTKVEGNMNNSELTITEQDTPISDCKSYLDNEWTPNTIAAQVTTVPTTGVFLVNGSITTTKPASGTAMRVANSRGGFGPELIEGSKIENPTPSGGSTPDVTTTTATGSWTASGIADAINETTTTQTTQIDLSDATLTNATPENKVTIPTANPNVIIKAKDAAQAATIANDNVVYNNGTEAAPELVCNSFVVKDGGNMKISEGFKATSAKYTRTVASGETLNGKLGTIYLPFPVKSDDNVKYYTFESLSGDGGTMNLTYVSELAANTPAVVKYVTDATGITASNASVAVVGTPSSTELAYKLMGTYEPITLTVTQDDARYYFAGTTGKFYSFTQAPNGVVNVPAFRAYFAPKNAQNAKAINLNINLIEGDVTGINDVNATTGSAHAQGTCYNLAGQKVNADTKGFVIKNGRKYFNK